MHTRSVVQNEFMSKSNAIDYNSMIQGALRQVVKDVLIRVEGRGLEGDHHYYITFATNHPWVEMPPYLKEQYPDEMAIILQHEFWDLEVTADAFSVTLCFDDINERIKVPFMALISFVDPSAKFGLQFVQDGESLYSSEDAQCDEHTQSERCQSNVVSIDDFRKK
jgi:hypothetical protein